MAECASHVPIHESAEDAEMPRETPRRDCVRGTIYTVNPPSRQAVTRV
jgi:hypothetical protein